MAPDDTLTAGIRPSATSRYTVALHTWSRSATWRTVRSRAVPRVRCVWIVTDAPGPGRRGRSVSDRRPSLAPVVSDTSVADGPEPTVSDAPGKISGPRGRRFKSCLPDSECRDSARETGESRPSPFPDGALRTTGAPKSVTLGADGARRTRNSKSANTVKGAAGVELPSAIPAFLEACGRLAAQAARRGNLTTARDFADKGARVAALEEHDTKTTRRGT